MINRNITSNCETCKPCGDCKGDGPIPDGLESPCDICNPCASLQFCSYCGNGSCICDLMVETDEGVMHKDCAEEYESKITKIRERARQIYLVTHGGNAQFEELGVEINKASNSLSFEDIHKTQRCIYRIASQLKEFCRLLPEGKKELVCEVVEEIGLATEFPDKLDKIELALTYVSSAVETSLQSQTNEREVILVLLRNIEFGISTLKLSSGSARQDLFKLQADVNNLRSQITLQGMSLEELNTTIQEKDYAMVERLEKMREVWLQTVEEMVQGLPRCEEMNRILTEIQVLKQSKKRDILGITGDISSIAGLFIGLIGLAYTIKPS